MKLFILVGVTILSCLSTSLAENNQKQSKVTATVLLYCDDKGNKIVATGHVPKEVAKIIKKSMAKYGKIEIVPAYKDTKGVPPIDKAIHIIKAKYKRVFVENVPKTVIAKIMAQKIMKMLGKTNNVKHYNVSEHTKSVASLTKAVLNKNLDSIPKHFNITPMIVNSFVPNTVYYAIDSKEHPVLHKYSHFKDLVVKMSSAWKKIKSVFS
ncbi:uncharacterized protein LOC126912368 [Spodoptera frugiperda]|uniref:Uncharacterized protein LOC126912368 n=1 Tax=Spodoptera frugiperda TaxID=7108 RepID=A0A9R0F5S3_SPOFR|nr:uncharacterized protein LOC126912368 [Spodoptera frugiperda]